MIIKEHTVDFTLPHDELGEMYIQIDTKHIEIFYNDRIGAGKTNRLLLSHSDFSRIADAVHIYGLGKTLIEKEAEQ